MVYREIGGGTQQICATGRRSIQDLIESEKLHEYSFDRTATDFADARVGTLFQVIDFSPR